MTSATAIGIAVLRVVLGVVMLAHGVQKFTDLTVSGVRDMLDDLGLPLVDVLAVALPVAEVGAGGLLVLGLLTRVAGGVTVVVALGALFTTHLSSGFFVADGGYELVLLIAAAGAALVLVGGGRLSLDAVLLVGRGPRVARHGRPDAGAARP